jgi:hypothetical protein
VWSSVDPDHNPPDNAEHTAVIVDARGRKSLSIEWNINFNGDVGFATIRAYVTNESDVAAVITHASADFVGWSDLAPGFTPEDFGLEIYVFTETPAIPVNFLEEIAPGDTKFMEVDAYWDGPMPKGFYVLPGEEYRLVGNFTITFDYEPLN